MKLNTKIMIFMVCFLVIGCNEQAQQSPDKPLMNTQIVRTYSDMALENAIISQHTLYPYHFVQNGAGLNELGKHDLAVLLRHYIKEPGSLNIRKADTPLELYTQRVEMVYQELEKAGLETDKIPISDDMPGGSGMASETIILILEKEIEETPSTNLILN